MRSRASLPPSNPCLVQLRTPNPCLQRFRLEPCITHKEHRQPITGSLSNVLSRLVADLAVDKQWRGLAVDNINIWPLAVFWAFGASLCFCVLASPAGRVFCVFVFWPCSPEGCVLCFRVFVFWAGCNGLCFVFLCFGPAQRSTGLCFVLLCFRVLADPPQNTARGQHFHLWT